MVAIVVPWGADGVAQPPPNSSLFQCGVFADSARALHCVDGTAGTVFRQYLWAWSPPGSGANYLTVRLGVPDNVDCSARPLLNPLVTDLIRTPYGPGQTEWNFILEDCPTGWILLFRQDCIILTGDASEIAVSGAHSLARNCDFVLDGMSALDALRINACSPTSASTSTWGRIKALFR